MPTVHLDRRGSVALLTLDRPETLNGFDAAMARALLEAVRSMARDPAVGCLVVTGAGKAFCAGGDVAAMRGAADRAALVRGLTQHLHPAVRLLATMEVPSIAAVNGATAGGGLGLALACDLRVASDRAKFRAAYMGIGLVPDGGATWFLPRLVGPARAREMLLLDEAVDAPRALALGLVDRVVPAERLLDESLALAARLAALPRFAAGKAKRLLARSAGADLASQLAEERRWNALSAARPDHDEGLRAFAEKRPPRFPSADPRGLSQG